MYESATIPITDRERNNLQAHSTPRRFIWPAVVSSVAFTAGVSAFIIGIDAYNSIDADDFIRLSTCACCRPFNPWTAAEFFGLVNVAAAVFGVGLGAWRWRCHKKLIGGVIADGFCERCVLHISDRHVCMWDQEGNLCLLVPTRDSVTQVFYADHDERVLDLDQTMISSRWSWTRFPHSAGVFDFQVGAEFIPAHCVDDVDIDEILDPTEWLETDGEIIDVPFDEVLERIKRKRMSRPLRRPSRTTPDAGRSNALA